MLDEMLDENGRRREWPVRLTGTGIIWVMARKIITAADMDKMTPQERADVVDASIVRSWDDVTPAFREQILRRAQQVAKTLPADA
jgi:hypothetical protein